MLHSWEGTRIAVLLRRVWSDGRSAVVGVPPPRGTIPRRRSLPRGRAHHCSGLHWEDGTLFEDFALMRIHLL